MTTKKTSHYLTITINKWELRYSVYSKKWSVATPITQKHGRIVVKKFDTKEEAFFFARTNLDFVLEEAIRKYCYFQDYFLSKSKLLSKIYRTKTCAEILLRIAKRKKLDEELNIEFKEIYEDLKPYIKTKKKTYKSFSWCKEIEERAIRDAKAKLPSIGNNIKRFRLERSMRLDDLMDAVYELAKVNKGWTFRASKSWMSKVEKSKVKLDEIDFQNFATALGTTVEELKKV